MLCIIKNGQKIDFEIQQFLCLLSYVTSINVPTQYLFSIKIYFRPKEEMHIVFGYHRISYIALYDVKENIRHRDVTSGGLLLPGSARRTDSGHAAAGRPM